jgi:hypothetical protein
MTAVSHEPSGPLRRQRATFDASLRAIRDIVTDTFYAATTALAGALVTSRRDVG